MKERYLEITFRKGTPFAAYYYLPRKPLEKSIKTEKVGEGALIDYGEAGRPIGIEIISPQKINLHHLNEILGRLNIAPIEQEEFAPLAVA